MVSARVTAGLGSWLGLAPLLVSLSASGEPGSVRPQAAPTQLLHLDFVDDGKQVKLLVRHSEIGLVCELWCYEGGPFQHGKGSRREDGCVVLVHTSGKMTATTTFTPRGSDRISMDVLVEGPLDELKKVAYMGPCMQCWHSESFRRGDSLAEFAGRCFIYTMRGPVGMLDTARGRMKDFRPDAPENNPPCTQWYVPIDAPHPGDIWGFGASGDRPLYGVVGVSSRDGKWLAAIGCAETRTLGQGWHDCIHHVPDMQAYLDERAGRILHRSMLYVMPNDRRRLLESFQHDCPATPARPGARIAAGKDGTLKVGAGSRSAPRVAASLDIIGAHAQPARVPGPVWAASPWGGFVRGSGPWKMWAYPHGETVDLWASAAVGTEQAPVKVKAVLQAEGWTAELPPAGVPALVRRSPDGAWVGALVWEQSEAGDAAIGVPSPAEGKSSELSVRGRLYLYKGKIEELQERWLKTREEWMHARPYRMPVAQAANRTPEHRVRFAPNAEEQMAYGLTIVPPWRDGGTLHANFPEHLEYGDVGYGILRHHNQRANPWIIAPDGRSASYEVESPELPGVTVRASAVAEGDRARLTLKITNGSGKPLVRVKPLLCFWYGKLAGFPGRQTDNFQHTYVVVNGKPAALADIPTSNPDASAKVAYVRGCSQHDCDKFAQSRGGLIDREIDCALIAVTARDGERKLLITFTPGKSILTNAFIPCAHADPYYGTLEPGQSAEATGGILFTEDPLDKAIAKLKGEI